METPGYITVTLPAFRERDDRPDKELAGTLTYLDAIKAQEAQAGLWGSIDQLEDAGIIQPEHAELARRFVSEAIDPGISSPSLDPKAIAFMGVIGKVMDGVAQGPGLQS